MNIKSKKKSINIKKKKNLEIFFLHIAICSEIVCHYVQNHYILTLLVPSTSSISSLKLPVPIGCTVSFKKFVYCTYFCNSLQQRRKSLEYESFDLSLGIYESVSSCLTEGSFMTWKINKIDCEVRGIFELITASRNDWHVALRGLINLKAH